MEEVKISKIEVLLNNEEESKEREILIDYDVIENKTGYGYLNLRVLDENHSCIALISFNQNQFKLLAEIGKILSNQI